MSTTPQRIDGWLQYPSEHRRLEFKEAKSQFSQSNLYNYCVGIANAGGGYLLLGITDRPPRSVVGTNAFLDPVNTEEKILQKLHFQVEVEEVHHPDGRVLVFHIPPRHPGVAYHVDGKYLMRSGSALVPMSWDQVRQICAETPDWEQNVHARDLVVANLLGEWSENNAADFDIVQKFTGEDGFNSWVCNI